LRPTIWIFALSLTVSGCRVGISREDLVGSYSGRYGFGSELVELRDDGSFVQHFKRGNAPRDAETIGRWKWNGSTGALQLEGFVNYSDGYCNPTGDKTPGFATFDPERALLLTGRIRLGPDEGCPLKRTE
jgi:hypothetical protein